MLYACERGIPSCPINLLYMRCLRSTNLIPRGTRSKIIQASWITLIEIESTENEVEVVVENAELDRAEHVGEAGGFNAVRVELGLSSKNKVPGRLCGLIEIKGTRCGKLSKSILN